MTASILDGKKIASQRQEHIKTATIEFTELHQRPPALAVVLVGEDKASRIYVSNKRNSCEAVGMKSQPFYLPESVSETSLLDLVQQLNHDPKIDGILVQLPLPSTINTYKIIEAINPQKDVDGFHPYNLGRLAQRNPLLRPCTPMGIMRLLKEYEIPIKSKYAVVIGASNIVGRPMTLELLHAGATVTTCHRFTVELERYVKQADILVIATGIPDLIHPEWLNSSQVVIDVGIHRLPDGSIRGDINYQAAADKVAWITPVPGGVGPMTIVSLLENTLLAAKLTEQSTD